MDSDAAQRRTFRRLAIGLLIIVAIIIVTGLVIPLFFR
jgi:hypothetical protein